MPNLERNSTPKEAVRKDREETLRNIYKYILGAGALVGIIAVSIAVSNICLTISVEKEKLSDSYEVILSLWWWVKHVIVGVVVLIALALAVAALDFLVPKAASKFIARLETAIDKLAGRTVNDHREPGLVDRIEIINNDLKDKIVGAFTSDLDRLKKSGNGIIETLRGTILGLGLVDEQIIFYKGDPRRTMRNFICHEVLLKNDIDIVRLAGTMLGVSGKGSYSITEHIAELTKRRLSDDYHQTDVFRECRVVLPGGESAQASGVAQSKFYQYPACGRFFAINTLEKIKKEFSDKPQPLPGSEIMIRLHFKNSDIFPAWHIWGNLSFLLACSIGQDDGPSKPKSQQIAEALPIALGARKIINRKSGKGEETFNLSETISRLKRHFDNDLFEENKKDLIESWVLSSDGTIKVINLQKSVWGNAKEEYVQKKVDFWDKLYDSSRKQDGRTLSTDELKRLRAIFKEIGEIEDENNSE